MDKTNLELLKKNPKVDPKVVAAVDALLEKLPDSAKPRRGSDYRIEPPLGGRALALNRRGGSLP
jgi:hypothetical protein